MTAGRRAVLALALAGLVAGAVILLVGTGGGSGHRHQRPRTVGSPPTSTTAPAMVSFRDPGRGFSISYPSSWTRLAPNDPEVPLLVNSPGGGDALLVRVTSLGLGVRNVTLRTLPTLRPLTDRLVHADTRARLLQPPAEVMLGGLPGFVYVYTEAGATRSGPIAHVHYFLFSGPTLIALVFQIAPASRLIAAAPILTRIEATFKGTVSTTPATTPG